MGAELVTCDRRPVSCPVKVAIALRDQFLPRNVSVGAQSLSQRLYAPKRWNPNGRYRLVKDMKAAVVMALMALCGVGLAIFSADGVSKILGILLALVGIVGFIQAKRRQTR